MIEETYHAKRVFEQVRCLLGDAASGSGSGSGSALVSETSQALLSSVLCLGDMVLHSEGDIHDETLNS